MCTAPFLCLCEYHRCSDRGVRALLLPVVPGWNYHCTGTIINRQVFVTQFQWQRCYREGIKKLRLLRTYRENVDSSLKVELLNFDTCFLNRF